MKDGNIIANDAPNKIFEQVDLLKSSKLDIPFNLKLYKEAEANSKLNANKELMDALWKLNF